MHYHATDLKEANNNDDEKIQNTIRKFKEVIQMEKKDLGNNEVSLFTFKCSKQIVKIKIRRNELTEELKVYRRLLLHEPKSPNVVKKGIKWHTR